MIKPKSRETPTITDLAIHCEGTYVLLNFWSSSPPTDVVTQLSESLSPPKKRHLALKLRSKYTTVGRSISSSFHKIETVIYLLCGVDRTYDTCRLVSFERYLALYATALQSDLSEGGTEVRRAPELEICIMGGMAVRNCPSFHSPDCLPTYCIYSVIIVRKRFKQGKGLLIQCLTTYVAENFLYTKTRHIT